MGVLLLVGDYYHCYQYCFGYSVHEYFLMLIVQGNEGLRSKFNGFREYIKMRDWLPSFKLILNYYINVV